MMLMRWIAPLTTSAAAAAFLSTGMISLAPNVILFLFPSYAAGQGQTSTWLSLGQALSAGCLLGDVFLHTLASHDHHHSPRPDPEKMVPDSSSSSSSRAENLNDDDDDHQSTEDGLWILAGFVFFLAADLLIRSLDQHSSHAHHSHSTNLVDNMNHRQGSGDNHHHHNNSRIHQNSSPTDSHLQKHDSKVEGAATPVVVINHSVVWLNLAADALHNFTDGLAIGATYGAAAVPSSSSAFGASSTSSWWGSAAAWSTTIYSSSSNSRGMWATWSIMLHEVPHELGDFCTLVRAGYSKRQAVLCQLLTAVAALFGTAVALILSSSSSSSASVAMDDSPHDAEDSSEWLILLTAGGFLYLSATTILPELLSDPASPLMRLAQLAAFLTGLALLYLVALMEKQETASGTDTLLHSTRIDPLSSRGQSEL